MHHVDDIDEAVGQRHGNADQFRDGRPGHQAVGHILGEIAAGEGIGAADGRQADGAMALLIQILPGPGVVVGTAREVLHGAQVVAQGVAHGLALLIHGQVEAAGRGGPAHLIQVKIDMGALDIGDVEQHGARMPVGIDDGQAAFQHVVIDLLEGEQILPHLVDEGRALLGGQEGSILDTYGTGEYEWDGYTVKFHLHRGTDSGVTVRYGKNLTYIEAEASSESAYDGVAPYWASQDEVVTLSKDPIIWKDGSGKIKAVPLDLSSNWQDKPTEDQLRSAAKSYVAARSTNALSQNIKIEFVQLWQTEEYKDIASLERVALFDTVHVFIPKLGVEATAKVVRTVFDPISERYTKIELGSVRADLGGVISKSTDKKVGVVARSIFDRVTYQIDSQIERATAFLTGAEGGYQITHYNNDGKPYETLWMDSPDESTATHILRINANGLGFSNDGGATYRNAWLIDGTLSADFIGSGTIDAINITGSNITGGVINGAEIDSGDMYWYKGTANEVSIRKATWNGRDGIQICSNQFRVGDKNNNSYINLNNSFLWLYAGSFVSVDDSGIFLQGKYGGGAITVNDNNVVLRMNGEQHGLKWVTIDGYKVPVAV